MGGQTNVPRREEWGTDGILGARKVVEHVLGLYKGAEGMKGAKGVLFTPQQFMEKLMGGVNESHRRALRKGNWKH